MFAGIVEAVVAIAAIEVAPTARAAAPGCRRLSVALGELADGLRPGASVAIDGTCLTLVSAVSGVVSFDVVPETWQRTTLCDRRPGDRVNVERSLRVGDRIDGHFVQGHVEGTGTIERIDRAGGECKLWIGVDAALLPCIVPKGSIAIDGVSLTVVNVAEAAFSVVLIPTTLERTTLGDRSVRQRVNLETDILARTIVRRLDGILADPRMRGESGRGITMELLRDSGLAP